MLENQLILLPKVFVQQKVANMQGGFQIPPTNKVVFNNCWKKNIGTTESA